MRSRSNRDTAAIRVDGGMLVILAMLALGGSNSTGPVQQVLAEWIGLALLAAPLLRTTWQAVLATDRMIAVLVCALAVLAVIQLIPLPASLWTAMGGRALYAHGDLLMMGRPIARPLSLAPDQTVAALAFAVAPLAIWLRARIDRDFGLRWIVVWLVFMAASLAMALYQVAAGPGAWRLFNNVLPDPASGLFSNRNHQALALACAMPLAAALERRRIDALARRRTAPGHPFILPAVVAGATLGALLTGSRTGNALLIPAWIATAAIVWRGRLTAASARRVALAAAAIATLAVIGAFVLAQLQPGGALGLLLSRSYLDEDDRYRFWPVVVRMIALYAPWGAGLGSFRRLLEVHEPTELLAPLYFNHAHSDWLEFVLETGVPGALLAAGFTAWMAWRWVGSWRARSADPIAQAAGAVVLLILLHSAVDYPLRTIAMASCFAACVGLLSPRSVAQAAQVPGPARRWLVRAAVALAALQIGASQFGVMSVMAGQPLLALKLPYAHAEPNALAAMQQAAAHAPQGRVARYAVTANVGSPLVEPAFAASARAFAGQPSADALLDQAIALSRHDPWALQAAFARAHARHDAPTEIAMLAALVRLQAPSGTVPATFANDLARPDLAAATATALAARPRWRTALIERLPATIDTAPALTALVTRLQAAGAPFDGDEIAGLLAPAIPRDAATRAATYRIWLAWLGTADPWAWPTPGNGASRLPFAWIAGDNARIEHAANGLALDFSGKDNAAEAVATRSLPLDSGAYRLVARGAQGLADSAISAAVTCDDARQPLANGAVWQVSHSCRNATIQLFANASSGTIIRAALVPAP